MDMIAALAAGDASTRLKAVLAIGSSAQPALLDTLVARCAVEPDFYVRDMLTWALTRLPQELTGWPRNSVAATGTFSSV
jgi:hypothetical protein